MSEKWWDMSDDELDDLFREASDKAEIPFDSSALDKLRQKIDFKPMPQPELQQGFKKRWIALAGLLIFFGASLLYTFSGKKTPITSEVEIIESNITQEKTSTIKGYAAEKNKGGLTNKGEAKYNLPIEKTLSNRGKFNDISEDKLLKNKPLDISSTKSISEKSLSVFNELSGNNSTIIKEKNSRNYVSILSSSKTNRKQSRLVKSKFNSNQVYNSSDYQETNVPISTSLIIPENKPLEEETIQKINFYNVDFLANKSTKHLKTNTESESPTYVDVPPIAMKQPKFSRFGVRFAIAPEINSIERMETSAVMGSMFALLLEYRLTNKLTLQTGVNYSKKKYTGNFEYYRAWMGGTGTKPLTVDGICSVVDIPINLRLNAFQMKRNTFFISAGVSSYLMSDEIYTYNYAWGPPKIRDWTGSSSSFYWSTLNLSAGVERKMNKHFTLQVEPFLKTPLVGVGRGMVNLYSSGLLFSTKYEF